MGSFNWIEILAKLGSQYVPFLFSLCFHEYAHGFIAKKRGDNTAELMGRLTLNPLAHADIIGTFVLPIVGVLAGVGGMNGGQGFIFGWAKPVPVNHRNLKNVRSDMFWIALAGPLSNLMLAVVAVFFYVIVERMNLESSLQMSLHTMLGSFVVINMLLCIFNLIPLHPLDGGKVIARFIPTNWNRMLEEHQNTLQIILIMFFVAGGFQFLWGPMKWSIDLIFRGVTGVLGAAS